MTNKEKALAQAKKALEEVNTPKRFDVKEETPVDEDGDIIFTGGLQVLSVYCNCYAVDSTHVNDKWKNAYKTFQWEECNIKDLENGDTVYLNSLQHTVFFKDKLRVAKYINNEFYAIDRDNLVIKRNYIEEALYKLVDRDE